MKEILVRYRCNPGPRSALVRQVLRGLPHSLAWRVYGQSEQQRGREPSQALHKPQISR